MAVDPKLRDVLDTLDEAPAHSRPDPDRDMLISVLRRLEIRGHKRIVRRQMTTVHEPVPPSHSSVSQEEFERLAAERDASAAALRAADDDRNQLRAKQAELEGRLADLEASNHGSHLSFVEDDDAAEDPAPIVEFRRVDLDTLHAADDNEDLVEFEDMGSRQASAFDEPDHGAWDSASDEVTWQDPDAPPAPHAGHTGPHVEWDDDQWSDDEGSWEQAHDDPDPYLHTPADTPTEKAWAEAGEPGDTSWEQAHDDPAPWTSEDSNAEGGAWEAAPDANGDALDDKTQRDLNELERQLRELESELAKRQAVTDDEDA